MTKYRKTPNNIDSEVHGETIMINVQLGKYFSLNESGTVLWKMLDQPIDEKSMINKLMDEYEIDSETCTKEVTTFINEMLNLKLIEVVSA